MEKRIDWGTFWMSMALTVSQRSIDPSTKHGCILVDEDNRLISMGYNSFPRYCFDGTLPLTRPEKYEVIIHSETNAIINSGDRSTKGATAFITGYPCTRCFGNMINAGIIQIIYGPVGSHQLSEKDVELVRAMNIDSRTMKSKIRIIRYEDVADVKRIEEFLDQVKEYTNDKAGRKDLING